MPFEPRAVAVLATDADIRVVDTSLTGVEVEVIALASLEEALLAPATVFLCDTDKFAPWPVMLRRILEVRPAARVVLLSRIADNGMWIEALCKGAYDILPKPATPKEVRSVLLGAISARSYCAVA